MLVLPNGGRFNHWLDLMMFVRTCGFNIPNPVKIFTIWDPFDACRMLEQLLTKDFVQTSADMPVLTSYDDLPSLENVFEPMLKDEAERDFPSSHPHGRNFYYLRKETGMTNARFAEYFDLSIRNVENWNNRPESLKSWIYDLMEYKLLKEDII